MKYIAQNSIGEAFPYPSMGINKKRQQKKAMYAELVSGRARKIGGDK